MFCFCQSVSAAGTSEITPGGKGSILAAERGILGLIGVRVA
jgi:hypothetical protein